MNTKALQKRLSFSSKYFFIHLLVTVCIAITLAILVFFIWYPEPFKQMAGGVSLYKLILGIDIICGPLLTLLIASPQKKHREIMFDISLIAFIQISALSYGVYAVFLARPAAIVFEYNRFRLVSYVDIDKTNLSHALHQYQAMPLFDIPSVGLRKQKNDEEINYNMKRYLENGTEIGMMPEYWIPYEQVKSKVWDAATPIPFLDLVSSKQKNNWQQAIAETGKTISDLRYHVVLTAQSGDWIALIDKDGSILHYAKIFEH